MSDLRIHDPILEAQGQSLRQISFLDSTVVPDPWKLAAERGLTIQPCRGPGCKPRNRCDNCRAFNEWFAITWNFMDHYSMFFSILEEAFKSNPERVRDLIAPAVLDIVEAYLEDETT